MIYQVAATISESDFYPQIALILVCIMMRQIKLNIEPKTQNIDRVKIDSQKCVVFD